MARIPIPEPVSGGLILSYRCSAACRHCMYACSPRWPADWPDEADLERGLSRLAAYIQPSPWGPDAISLNHGLHFTGGEPFLNFELLLRAVSLAEAAGIPSTFVETNAFWCTADAAAREKLSALRAAGLRGIMVSVNPFFLEFVPFERTERCVRISLEVFRRNVFVYQQEYWRQFREMGLRDKLPLEEYVVRTGNRQFVRRAELFLMGRAASALREAFPAHPAAKFLDVPCAPPVLRSWHNHFDNYGHFMPGYCGGLSLGDWRSLDELLAEGIDGDAKPVLRHLVSDDMAGLLRFAEDRGFRQRREGYVSKCDLCLDLRRHLAAAGDFAELSPKEFYQWGLDSGSV
jgi:hypothetical protein